MVKSIWISANFQIFALTTGGGVLGGEGIVWAEECLRNMSEGECPGRMSYTRKPNQTHSQDTAKGRV